MIRIKQLLLFITLISLLLCASCEISLEEDSHPSYAISFTDNGTSMPDREPPDKTPTEKPKDGKTLTVHFIDVGQGDSIFIELPDGKCMLIDSGEWYNAGKVITFIDCLGYKKIDHLLATHPHSDHIGSMKNVIESFDIGKVYMPEAVSDTSTFIKMLEALDAKGASITPVTAGLKVDFGFGVSGEFVAPSEIVEDLNNCSAVLKLTYGEKSFLFTGDAEISEELTITADIDCDVLKVGHHGSYTSSGTSFLQKVSAEIAVISCGKDNDYGHPHKEALDRLSDSGIGKIYRTDISGTVTISCDGRELNVSEGFTPSGHKWVLNISSKKVHLSSCDSAIEMKAENKAYSKRTLEELQKHGYTLCGSCKPKE